MEKTKVPVVTTVMGKGSIPTDHPLYIGNLGMHGAYAANMAVSNCDVLFSIGTRFNDRITGKLHEFAPHAQIIHIDIDTASISRNIQVDIPIVALFKSLMARLSWPMWTSVLGLYPRIFTFLGYSALPSSAITSFGRSIRTGPQT